MQNVHEKYPADVDIAALYAEAVMNLSPWNVFVNDPNSGKKSMNANSMRAYNILAKTLYPQEDIPLTINRASTLHSACTHPLILHLWIHLMESGPLEYVQLAEKQADKLWALAAEPAGRKLGHLLHM